MPDHTRKLTDEELASIMPNDEFAARMMSDLDRLARDIAAAQSSERLALGLNVLWFAMGCLVTWYIMATWG